MLMAKVYVSSTFVDLEEYREKVEKVLRRMGHTDVAMEYYVAEDRRPVERCLQDVAESDLYAGIFAWRYGWQPLEGNPDQLSITEMEYRKAIETGKTCLIFLLSEDAPWPRRFMDKDAARIEGLRAELSARHSTGPHFKSPDELGRLVAEAVHNWEKEHGSILPRVLIPEFDLSAYFAALTRRYQRLDLDALTPPQKEAYLQLQLRSVFVEQNVRENPPPVELTKELWEKLRREKEIHPDDLPSNLTIEEVHRAREAYYEKPLRPVLTEIADPHRQHIIILGDPGSGKSTLSRYVLLSLVGGAGDEQLRSAFEGYLPLLIELRSYAGLCADGKCDTFLEFLGYMGETEGWHLNKDSLHHYLKTDGRAVVIFDGLDEIFEPEARERAARRIAGFAAGYPTARIIVTSRVIGYRRKILEDAGFAHFTLQDLDEKQVGEFVDRWYSLALDDRPGEARDRRERIMRSFSESPSIRQLAGNPMLLTIMAIIGKHQELPRERWKLYDHAASVLIQHWDINKHLEDRNFDADLIEEEDKKELLRRLAYRMQAGDGGMAGNYVHREQLQEEFEGYLKARYGQSPVEAAKTARAIIEQFRERNFILSLYGANVYGFVHRAFLEYFCAAAFVNKFEKTQEITLEELKSEVYGRHYEDQTWHEVLRLICGMIDEKFAGGIIDYLTNDLQRPLSAYSAKQPPWNIVLAVQCLSELRNPSVAAESAKSLLEIICSLFEVGAPSNNFQLFVFLEQRIESAIEIIGNKWPYREQLIQWLKDTNLAQGGWFYADFFGHFVGSIGKGLEEVYQALENYLIDDDENYRCVAISALAKGWNHIPPIMRILCDFSRDDSSENVRGIAVLLLNKYFKNSKQNFLIASDRIINDPSSYVRHMSIFTLEDAQNEPEALKLLHQSAENEPNSFVRASAISSLSNFEENERTFSLLRSLAVNDSSGAVRRSAIEALSKGYRDYPQTLSVLHDRAANDESPSTDYPETKYGVRGVAIKAIAQYWPSHPETLKLLRERAENDPTLWLRERAKKLADELEAKNAGG
jgi:hypothetical protein